ncbi:sterol desaturase family protein [Negadavirga shengliensis]|uniref:Sterol desaturase family protein n=1 Tax=Negadavirga shengliensis TaxID=1389218 RepID=A0ABV9SW23_9BACT
MVYSLLFIGIGFIGMEISGAVIHKYLMHGVFWNIHKTHHMRQTGIFEKNDLFSLFFGGIAILLIVVGMDGYDFRFWTGWGMSLYGISYFLLHDLLIHRRMKLFKGPQSGYLAAMIRAHRAHHAHNQKHNAVSFGLFIVPFRFLKAKKRR